jgi:hypothetical protein
MVLYLKKYHETEFLMKRMKFIHYNRRNWRRYSKNVDFSLIDGFTKVTKDAAVYTRKIALEEGIL